MGAGCGARRRLAIGVCAVGWARAAVRCGGSGAGVADGGGGIGRGSGGGGSMEPARGGTVGRGMGSDRRRWVSVRLIGCVCVGVCAAALVGVVRVLAAAGRDGSATRCAVWTRRWCGGHWNRGWCCVQLVRGRPSDVAFRSAMWRACGAAMAVEGAAMRHRDGLWLVCGRRGLRVGAVRGWLMVRSDSGLADRGTDRDRSGCARWGGQAARHGADARRARRLLIGLCAVGRARAVVGCGGSGLVWQMGAVGRAGQ
jgi:hypothetical protein